MPSVGEPGYVPYCGGCSTMIRMHRDEQKKAFVCRKCGLETRKINGEDMFDQTALTPMQRMRPEIDKNIATMGQHLIGVFPRVGTDDKEQFVYTIGLAAVGLPELLMIAPLPIGIAGRALNELADALRKDRTQFDLGKVDIEWSFPFAIRQAGPTAKTEYTIQAGQYLGREDYDVMQVMICDKNGLYPDEPGCQLPVPMP